MGYNPLIQFIMQPVLVFAVIFHFVMGFVLEIKNKKARPVGYNMNNGSANSTWMSRNMLISGAVVLAFIFLHMYFLLMLQFSTSNRLANLTSYVIALSTKIHSNIPMSSWLN